MPKKKEVLATIDGRHFNAEIALGDVNKLLSEAKIHYIYLVK